MKHPTKDRLRVTIARYLDEILGDEVEYNAVENRPHDGTEDESALNPDIEIFHLGKVFMIESAAPKAQLTLARKTRHRKLRRAGVSIGICRSLDDVRRFLRVHGIPLKSDTGAYRPKTTEQTLKRDGMHTRPDLSEEENRVWRQLSGITGGGAL